MWTPGSPEPLQWSSYSGALTVEPLQCLIGADNELREAVKEMVHEKIRTFMTKKGGD